MTNNGLYIHIPFCESKCVYCDFLSFANRESETENYVSALTAEMRLNARRYGGKVFDTVYIGGGTPGILPPFLLKKIFDGIRENFVLAPDTEITIEINPSSMTAQKAEAFARCGINRVSIGLQSVNDTQLKALGRRHTNADFVNTVNLVKNAGIKNISADLLLGIEGQTEDQIASAVDLFDRLELTHVSAYGLKVERGTPLSALVKKKKVVLPDDDRTVDLYDFAVSELAKNGYERYEVSNFCRSGFHSRHNVNCWRCQDYLGLGLGAHSCMDGKRFANVRDMQNYISKIQAGKPTVSYSRRLTSKERFDERIMLGLRLAEGLNLDELNNDFGTDFINENKAVKDFIERNILIFRSGMLKLNPQHFYVMNSVLSSILE